MTTHYVPDLPGLEDPQTPSAADASPPAASAFAAFVESGHKHRAARLAGPRQPQDTADPDPNAIALLPAHRRPAARLLARRGGRDKSRRTFEAQIKQSCRLLQQAAAVQPDDWQDATVYPWHHVDRDHADRYRQLVHARYSNVGTRNLYLSVVREVLRECFRADLIDARRFEDVLQALPTKVAMRTSRGRRLTTEEVSALLGACLADTGQLPSARDAAVIAVLATTGMRASDLVDLDLRDWNAEERSLYLACTKNGHPHTVYLPTVAVPYLERWLAVRGTDSGPLFTKVIGAPLQPMAYSTVRSMLKTRATQAAVKPLGSHDFRRTVATLLLRTHDTGIVSRILGHRDVASTAVYDMAGPEECRAAVETLPMPPLPSPVTDPQRDVA